MKFFRHTKKRGILTKYIALFYIILFDMILISKKMEEKGK